jgi:co-chaperonin GroES (HSP10)
MTKLHLEPVGHRVLVIPDKLETETESGIVFRSDSKVERGGQIFGTLVAIGPNAWKAFDDGEPWAYVGDKVAYARYSGKHIEDPETDTTYIILNDDDIVARVEYHD